MKREQTNHESEHDAGDSEEDLLFETEISISIGETVGVSVRTCEPAEDVRRMALEILDVLITRLNNRSHDDRSVG